MGPQEAVCQISRRLEEKSARTYGAIFQNIGARSARTNVLAFFAIFQKYRGVIRLENNFICII